MSDSTAAALVARPHDFNEIGLQKYKGLVVPYTDADYLIGRCRALAEMLIKRELEAPDKGHIR